jgi:hypothetical protein
MNWKHITISQYQQLLPSDLEDLIEIEKMILALSVCFRMTMDDVRALPLKKARKLNKKIEFIRQPFDGKVRPTFRHKRQRYRIECNAFNLNFDQYMTAMEILKDLNDKPETVEKNLHLLIANISRPINILGKDKVKFNLITMANDFKQLPMSLVFPIITEFLKSLEKLNASYKKLFDYRGGENTPSKTFSKWGWIITLDNLSNSDASKWNYYKALSVIEALNICSYYKAKADETERVMRLEKMKNKFT